MNEEYSGTVESLMLEARKERAEGFVVIQLFYLRWSILWSFVPIFRDVLGNDRSGWGWFAKALCEYEIDHFACTLNS